jgi:hypothetical protein
MSLKMPSLEKTDLVCNDLSPFLVGDMSYALIPPTRFKGIKQFTFPDLLKLGELAGLSSEEQQKCLKAHSGRLKKFRTFSVLVMLTSYLLIVAIGFVAADVILDRVFHIPNILDTLSSLPTARMIAVILVFSIPWGIYVFLAALIGRKISSTLLDRQFADTLAFTTSLHLFLQLSLDGGLLLSENRNRAIKRTRGLRRSLILLSYQFSSPGSRAVDWAQRYFKNLEYFAEDLERHMLIPKTETWPKLLENLYSFTRVLLTSRYGEFEVEEIAPLPEEKIETPSRRIAHSLLRILGLFTPLILFLGMVFYPNLFNFGAYNGIVALVSLAWLLLAIDTSLNLGFVDRVSTLAKAIKELK